MGLAIRTPLSACRWLPDDVAALDAGKRLRIARIGAAVHALDRLDRMVLTHQLQQQIRNLCRRDNIPHLQYGPDLYSLPVGIHIKRTSCKHVHAVCGGALDRLQGSGERTLYPLSRASAAPFGAGQKALQTARG